MANKSKPKDLVIIKKYANRRLYDTSTSSYVTLDHLSDLVRQEIDFEVVDAKSKEDLTRQVLTQIIFEQETKPSDFHFSLDVQKQLISMYGDAYGKMMPDYLEESMNLFASERDKMQATFESFAGQNAKAMMDYTQALAKQNMELFRQSMNMLSGNFSGSEVDETADKNESRDSELEAIQKQIDALQERLKALK